MNHEESLFERFFGLTREDEEPIFLSSRERSLAQKVYEVACGEVHVDDEERDDDPDYEFNDGYDDDTDSVSSFDMRMQSAVEKFKRVVKLFRISKKAKAAFLENFGDWSSIREFNIQRLKEIAKEIENYKFGSDITKVIGGVVTVVGGVAVGLSFLTPLAAITLPLSISGGFAVAVTKGLEVIVLKNKVEEANTLAKQEELSFLTTVAPWFTHTKELKAELTSLVSYSLLKEMSEYLQDFHDVNAMNPVNRFKQALKLCIRKMCKSSNIMESFGVVIAPAVMTFVIVVCLLRFNNRIFLDCVMQTESLMISKKAIRGEFVYELNSLSEGIFVINAVIELMNVVLTFMDIYNCSEVEDAKKVREVADRLEDEFLFIKSVCNEILLTYPNRS